MVVILVAVARLGDAGNVSEAAPIGACARLLRFPL
jgi:hypothetical protein